MGIKFESYLKNPLLQAGSLAKLFQFFRVGVLIHLKMSLHHSQLLVFERRTHSFLFPMISRHHARSRVLDLKATSSRLVEQCRFLFRPNRVRVSGWNLVGFNCRVVEIRSRIYVYISLVVWKHKPELNLDILEWIILTRDPLIRLSIRTEKQPVVSLAQNLLARRLPHQPIRTPGLDPTRTPLTPEAIQVVYSGALVPKSNKILILFDRAETFVAARPVAPNPSPRRRRRGRRGRRQVR